MSQAPLQPHCPGALTYRRCQLSRVSSVTCPGPPLGGRRTSYYLILEALPTDVLHANPNPIICFLGRFLCTFAQGMKGEKTGWAGQRSAATEAQGSSCSLQSRGAARTASCHARAPQSPSGTHAPSSQPRSSCQAAVHTCPSSP